MMSILTAFTILLTAVLSVVIYFATVNYSGLYAKRMIDQLLYYGYSINYVFWFNHIFSVLIHATIVSCLVPVNRIIHSYIYPKRNPFISLLACIPIVYTLGKITYEYAIRNEWDIDRRLTNIKTFFLDVKTDDQELIRNLNSDLERLRTENDSINKTNSDYKRQIDEGLEAIRKKNVTIAEQDTTISALRDGKKRLKKLLTAASKRSYSITDEL